MARCLAEIETAAWANIRLATAPVIAGHLHGEVGHGVPPGQAAERRVGEGDHRVEIGPGHRPEHQDDGEQAGRGGAEFSSNSRPVSPGDSFWAAIPEPITIAARKALPRNSGVSRRHSAIGELFTASS